MSAKDYAVKLLSVSDRSEKELRERLCRKGFDESEAEEAIDFCKEYGYIEDSRYAEHFVNDAVNLKKWGSVRIKAELRKKGVDEEFFEALLEELPEYETLVSEMKRRFGSEDMKDQKVRNRIFGYFARRGYKTGDILRAMGEERDYDEYIE